MNQIIKDELVNQSQGHQKDMKLLISFMKVQLAKDRTEEKTFNITVSNQNQDQDPSRRKA